MIDSGQVYYEMYAYMRPLGGGGNVSYFSDIV